MIVLLLLVPVAIAILVITLRSYFHKRYQPSQPVISSSGTVNAPLNPKGSVLINGELWLARSADGLSIPVSARVAVIGVEGHLLLVTTI